MSAASDLVRKQFAEGDARRDAGLTTPEDVVRYDDIPYGKDPRWQALDVYRPRAAQGETLPVIVSVHGGAWVYGSKEVYQFYCMGLAQRGFAVVNFSYRLAPEHPHPAALEDVNSAFGWVLANAKAYGFDTKRVFAVGDSAGGHLLGLYSALCSNAVFAAQSGIRPPKGFVPRAVALNCGKYRIEMTGDEDDQTRQLMRDFLPGGGTAQELRQIDVTAHVTQAFPPTFLMTANGDFLREQAPLMARCLMENSVPFVFRFYGDARHELGHVFHCDVRSEDARRCNDDECAFFRSFA